MKWSAAVLAGLAVGAGFATDDVPTAVAVALATSQGDDLWRWHGPVPGSGDYRGLWGIDVDAYPETATWSLWRPSVNAAAAKLLTDEVGTFSWAPAYRSGMWRRRLDEATAAAAAPDRHPVFVPHTPPDGAAHVGDRLSSQVDRLGQTVANLQQRGR